MYIFLIRRIRGVAQPDSEANRPASNNQNYTATYHATFFGVHSTVTNDTENHTYMQQL